MTDPKQAAYQRTHEAKYPPVPVHEDQGSLLDEDDEAQLPLFSLHQEEAER